MSGLRGGIRQRLEGATEGGSSSSAQPVEANGIRKRLRREGGASEASSFTPFTSAIKRDWGRGKLQANTAQEYATKAAAQGARDLGKIAKTSDTRHAHRDLARAIGWPSQYPHMDWIDIPTPDGPLTPHPIICPIKVFERMLQDIHKFNRILRGDDGDIKKFWRGMRNTKIFDGVKDSLDFTRSIPLGVHGDKAACTKTQSLMTIAWTSLLGTGSTKDTHQVFTVIRAADMVEGTLSAIWDRFAWSMNALSDGVIPPLDFRGNPHPEAGRIIAKGWKASLIHVRADWEFAAHPETVNQPAWNAEPNMCFFCNASNSVPGLRWSDFSAEAGWRSTRRSHESYKAMLAHEGKPLPPLFKVKTLRMEGVQVDVLHAVDQGLASHCVANVFIEVMRDSLVGTNWHEKLRDLQDKLKAHGKTSGHKIDGELTFERIKTKGEWPKLKAKAANTRHISRFALRLCQEFNSGSAHDMRRLGVMQQLVRFYDIVETEGRFLTETARSELPVIAESLLTMYGALSREALASRVRCWKMTQKFHMFQHCCDRPILNPRVGWTYADEDLQNLIKHVGMSCHPRRLAERVFHKWFVFLSEAEREA